MAKAATRNTCQECGAVHNRWSGRCSACGGWNTILEEVVEANLPRRLAAKSGGRDIGLAPLNDPAAPGSEGAARTATGLAEFDRVCGGGLVPGSAILLGGDPGIGKSTLLLQAMAALARHGIAAAYVSGEEAAAQIRLRARRLGLADAPVGIAAANNVGDIRASLERERGPHVVVIDSIQTMFLEGLDSAPGTVSQVRAAAQVLIGLAKRAEMVLILVGHVTKDGQLAGPRVLEHMVDTVLYFEGERAHPFRLLRAVKNRFGPADEIGVFEMTDAGLAEVKNPSSLFLSNRQGAVSGTAVFAGIEGSRPVLVEVQALVTASHLASPRRTVVGWDGNRLSMLIAVLDARCGLGLAGHDIYLNIAGGLRIGEPAADLAVAAALVSSLTDRPLPDDAVVFGEVSLTGEVRPVRQADARLREAAKLGFARAYLPPAGSPRQSRRDSALRCETIAALQELVQRFTSPEDIAAGAS